MRGAILGDIIGSVHEHRGTKTTEFPLFTDRSSFTDDTVMSIATADCLLHAKDPAQALRHWGRRYPHAGYGGMFREWLFDSRMGDYGSWGNGGPMRISPCAYLVSSLSEALEAAQRVTKVTHSHPEAVRGAEAVTTAIWLGRNGRTPEDIRGEIAGQYGYDLSRSINEIRNNYGFDVSATGTVPPALTAALEATSTEEAIRLAVSLGGDADTLACIAGAVAEPLYGVPDELWAEAEKRLPPAFLDILSEFDAFLQSSVRGSIPLSGSPRQRSDPARPEHQPGAASQQSPRACVSSWTSVPSSFGSHEPYLRADHFKQGGSMWRSTSSMPPRKTPALQPRS